MVSDISFTLRIVDVVFIVLKRHHEALWRDYASGWANGNGVSRRARFVDQHIFGVGCVQKADFDGVRNGGRNGSQGRCNGRVIPQEADRFDDGSGPDRGSEQQRAGEQKAP